MNLHRFTLGVLLLGGLSGCGPAGPVRTASERELLRVWSSASSSVDDRAEALNRCFSGTQTPASALIALLGTNYARFHLIAVVWTGRPYEEKAMELTYAFGGEAVFIQVLAPVEADSFSGTFNGATSSTWRRDLTGTLTNHSREGQLDGAANRSLPIRLETNQTSAAGGSGR